MSRIGSAIRSRPVLAATFGAAVLLAGVGAVSAQYGGGWGGGGQGYGGWRGHHGEGRGAMGRGARLDRFCTIDQARWAPVMRAWIKADLNLNGAQSAEFDKLADTAQPAMEQIRSDVCGSFGPGAPKVTAPERLEKAAGSMRKAADAMDRVVPAAKAFYASLDETQKARIEQMMERRRGMHRGGWHRGGWESQPGGQMPPQPNRP